MKTHRVCRNCESELKRETVIKGYPFYCPVCDENKFYFETIRVRQFIKEKGRKPKGFRV